MNSKGEDTLCWWGGGEKVKTEAVKEWVTPGKITEREGVLFKEEKWRKSERK